MIDDGLMIGSWARRNVPGQKWHLIESQIEDRIVTRCGREMHLVDRRRARLFYQRATPIGELAACRYCIS